MKKIKKKSFLLTVDLEDISHDLLYSITKNKNIKLKEDSLLKSYNLISNILKKYFLDTKITFFSTGIIAQKFPDFIKQISNDGHEIACHHYYHDRLEKKNIYEFERDIVDSIFYINKSCNKVPLGYRAPFFSIHGNKKMYEILKKYFKYDSSYLCFKNNNISNLGFDNNFKQVHVYSENFFFTKIRSGGSFFRFLTSKKINKMLNCSFENQLLPQIYLHPYDLLKKKEFWIKFNEFEEVSILSRLYFWLQQYQWHSLGNSSVEEKLIDISKEFRSLGTIKSILNLLSK